MRHIDHNVRVSSYTQAVYKKIIAISKETDNRKLQTIGQIENKISNQYLIIIKFINTIKMVHIFIFSIYTYKFMVRLYDKLVHTSGVNDNSCNVIYRNCKLKNSNLYKLTNIFLLVLLILGSCGVSFGVEREIPEENNQDVGDSSSKSLCRQIVSVAIPCLTTGILGYNNTYRHLFGNFYISMHNFYNIIDPYFKWLPQWCRFLFGSIFFMQLNSHIPFRFPITKWDMDLHIFGLNAFTTLAKVTSYILLGKLLGVDIVDFFDRNFFQFCDFEIKVCEYWSISLNLLVLFWTLIERYENSNKEHIPDKI